MPQRKKSTSASIKKEDRFEWLARIMKEGLDDVQREMTDMEGRLHKEMKDMEGRLRTEIREVEENLGYRIGKVSTDIYRHVDKDIEPRLEEHERRIKRLELAGSIRA